MPLGMSNLLRNLNEAKANIQMQKTGAEGWFVSPNFCPLLIWGVGLPIRSSVAIGV